MKILTCGLCWVLWQFLMGVLIFDLAFFITMLWLLTYFHWWYLPITKSDLDQLFVIMTLFVFNMSFICFPLLSVFCIFKPISPNTHHFRLTTAAWLQKTCSHWKGVTTTFFQAKVTQGHKRCNEIPHRCSADPKGMGGSSDPLKFYFPHLSHPSTKIASWPSNIVTSWFRTRKNPILCSRGHNMRINFHIFIHLIGWGYFHRGWVRGNSFRTETKADTQEFS